MRRPERWCSARLPALAAVATCVLISACATAPREDPAERESPETAASPIAAGQRWARQLAAVRAMGDWQVRGKVAWHVPDDAGSASIVWSQVGGDAELRLTGPLGVGSTRVTRDGALIRVRREGIERNYPADAAPWLPNGAVLPLPVESIAWWLRGVPDPALTIDGLRLDDGRALSIRQGGWEITIDAYHETGAPSLPARLTFEAPAADLRLRMIVRQWTVNDSASVTPSAVLPAAGDGPQSTISRH